MQDLLHRATLVAVVTLLGACTSYTFSAADGPKRLYGTRSKSFLFFGSTTPIACNVNPARTEATCWDLAVTEAWGKPEPAAAPAATAAPKSSAPKATGTRTKGAVCKTDEECKSGKCSPNPEEDDPEVKYCE